MKAGNVKVFFRYENDQTKIKAVLINDETKENIADREVILRHGDKPNKILGRKYAFKKLMTFAYENGLLLGNQVEALWREFSSTHKQPNTKLAY